MSFTPSTTGPDMNRTDLARAPGDLPATCQYCLADCRHTTLRPHPDRRCPVCGSDYTGPRRDREYATLLASGLVAREA